MLWSSADGLSWTREADGESPFVAATAAVWRDGRVIEVLEVTGDGRAAQEAAIVYAQKLWHHVHGQ